MVNYNNPNFQMGPFVERKNAYMKLPQFSEEYGDVMDELMRKIAKSLEGRVFNSFNLIKQTQNIPCRTELIVQPAPFRDACSIPVFPTPALKICSDVCKKFGRRLHSVPEPCVVRINGVELALTSSEVKVSILIILFTISKGRVTPYLQIISHLSKSEWHRSEDQENRDRIARLASHMLEQGSLYPLFPPALPTSIEECIKVCSLRSAPHVIVCPSVLASFIKIINKTVIVNPGIAARGATGTFLRCELATSIVEDVTNLPDCSKFEIVRF
uniref:DNA polymerase alpha subunit B n=1 Tax=Angiostrongylus cantonensis TaxID=6313 RepID=A0A0K0DH57_ANGCA